MRRKKPLFKTLFCPWLEQLSYMGLQMQGKRRNRCSGRSSTRFRRSRQRSQTQSSNPSLPETEPSGTPELCHWGHTKAKISRTTGPHHQGHYSHVVRATGASPCCQGHQSWNSKLIPEELSSPAGITHHAPRAEEQEED